MLHVTDLCLDNIILSPEVSMFILLLEVVTNS